RAGALRARCRARAGAARHALQRAAAVGGLSAVDHLESADFEEFAASLAPDVVWVGLRPGELCRNRDQVVATFRQALESGKSGSPEVVAEAEGLIGVDPHVEPPLEAAPERHHVFV